MSRVRSMVLLSGGLDSTAALFWSIRSFDHTEAIGFDYGQPHACELDTAQRIAGRHEIPWTRLALADALSTKVGLMGSKAPPEGHDPMFVPGRNLVFLSIAAAHACARWNQGPICLVVGACAEDAAGFPDCLPDFFEMASNVLTKATDRSIWVAAPYVHRRKDELINDTMASSGLLALESLQISWSCYRGRSEPCGACPACVKRAKAFHSTGLEDYSERVGPRGGDAHRAHRLGMK